MKPEWVPDCDDDPIAVARAVLDICNTKYIYCGGKERIASTLAAMEKCAAMSEANRAINRMHELRKLIVCSLHEYTDIMEEMANKKEEACER
jgi:predicted transcriptional regulator of viral defense system